MRRLLSVILLSLSIGISVAQPAPHTLQPEQWTERTLEESALVDTLYIDVTEGDIIRIQAEPSRSEITYTELRTPDGMIWARYEPSYFPGVQLGWIRIPTSGRYSVVTALRSAGSYAISYSYRPIPVLDPFSSPREFFAPYLPSAPFAIDGQAGQVIYLRAFSQDLDPILTLFAPDGTRLAENDDSGGFLDAELLHITLPTTGRYIAEVSHHGTNSAYDAVYVTYWEADQRWMTLGDERIVEVLPNTAWQPLTLYARMGQVLNISFEVLEGAADLTVRDSRSLVLATTKPNEPQSNVDLTRLYIQNTGELTLLVTMPNHDAPAKARLKVELSDAPPIDNLTLSFGLSSRMPSKTISLMTYSDGYLSLTIGQPSTRPTCGAYRVEVLRDTTVLGAFTADFEGMACGDIPLYLATGRQDGVIMVRVTSLSQHFVFFQVTTQVGYGEG